MSQHYMRVVFYKTLCAALSLLEPFLEGPHAITKVQVCRQTGTCSRLNTVQYVCNVACSFVWKPREECHLY